MANPDKPKPAPKATTSPGMARAAKPSSQPEMQPAPPPLLTAPNGHPLPLAYRWLRGNGVHRLLPWTFLDDADEAQRLRGEFVREVSAPNTTAVRDLFPFAQRKDRDEVAGFIVTEGHSTEEVALVALTWRGRPEKPGWPAVQRFADLWAFAREALIDDAQEWANEEALSRLLGGKHR